MFASLAKCRLGQPEVTRSNPHEPAAAAASQFSTWARVMSDPVKQSSTDRGELIRTVRSRDDLGGPIGVVAELKRICASPTAQRVAAGTQLPA
jgi:hypothetical protein